MDRTRNEGVKRYIKT